MPGLYNWRLVSDQDRSMAKGVVYGHPKLPDGMSIHTSPIREMTLEDGGLVLITVSGSRYVLRPEEIDPERREDTASVLALSGIGAGFAERCIQARHEADKRLLEEARETKPGELLLTTVGTRAIRALFRADDGTPVSVRPIVRRGMFLYYILITDLEAGRVDFRYFPREDWMEPYHVSDGLRVIKVRNLGTRAVCFGAPGREVVCPAGAVTAVPAAEHCDEWLYTPDTASEKGLRIELLPNDGGEADHQ